jgi:hypothetical protein
MIHLVDNYKVVLNGEEQPPYKVPLSDLFFLFELQKPGIIQLCIHAEPVPIKTPSTKLAAHRLFHSEKSADALPHKRNLPLGKHILDIDALLDEIVSFYLIQLLT